MHNLEELHYPIKKFELFQRPNVKVKILTFNDFSRFSLIFIDIHRIYNKGYYIARERMGSCKELEARKF